MNPLATVGGLGSVAVAEHLGLMGAATLMHPNGLTDYLPVVDPARFVDPKEALVDVYRVVAPMQWQMERTGKGVKKLRKVIDELRSPNQHVGDFEALGFLKRIAEGVHSISTPTQVRVSMELLRENPEWLPSASLYWKEMEALRSYTLKQIRGESDKIGKASFYYGGIIGGAAVFALGFLKGLLQWDWVVTLPMAGGVVGITLFLSLMRAKRKSEELSRAHEDLMDYIQH